MSVFLSAPFDVFLPTSTTSILVMVGAALLSCSTPKTPPESDLEFTGTIKYRQLEGGVWLIESDDGTTYEPNTVPSAFRKEGLVVQVWADRREDRASIHMAGPIIEIKRIERAER